MIFGVLRAEQSCLTMLRVMVLCSMCIVACMMGSRGTDGVGDAVRRESDASLLQWTLSCADHGNLSMLVLSS